MGFLSSIWSFLSLVIIAWVTQRIITHREKIKKIEETKLAMYLSWMPFFAECYVHAYQPRDFPLNESDYRKKKMETLGTLQIMGPIESMDAFVRFCEMAERGFAGDNSFDAELMHRAFTALNGSLCCEIHGERQCRLPPEQRH
jgi:hypothetical protein